MRIQRYLPRRIAAFGQKDNSVTPSQQRAVERIAQDVCVVAGPGSGKTRVLIERFAWLVESQNCDPSRILAITFTEKAAAEIKQRLIGRFSGRPELREAIERAWVSTIDGLCARLLRENAIACGLNPDFQVMDEPSAQRLARESAEDALEEIFREQPGVLRRLLESLDLATQEDGPHPDLARGLLEIYEAQRISGIGELPPPQLGKVWPEAIARAREIVADRDAAGSGASVLREWADRFMALPSELTIDHFALLEEVQKVHLGRIGKNSAAAAAARELKNELGPRLEQQWIADWNSGLLDLLRAAVARIDSLYRERKHRDGLLDFADLETEAIRLLESDAAVRRRTAARFDEVLMDELQDTNRLQWRLLNLLRGRLFAAGDINQSIYGFRHAEPAVFHEYRAGLLSRGLEIDDLRENHRSLSPILDAVSRVLDGAPGIVSRSLIGTRGGGPAVEHLVAEGDDASDVEAGMAAARIVQLVEEGRKFRDIAILVRTMGAARPFARALDDAGIPFLISGGRTFLEAREIRDLMALLAALVNPLDEIALIGVLRSPLAGVSDEEIFRIGRAGWTAEFDKRFGELRARAGFDPPDLLLASALDRCGYAAGLPERAQANIDKFLGLLRRDHRYHPLAMVLQDLESLRALESETEAPPADAGDVVRLMSIHAAKGLEFPVVFVSALHRGPDRRKPVIAFSATAGLGARWRNPATGKSVSDTAHARIVEDLKRRDEAEENRLLYVAMTRAQDRLILSEASGRRKSSWQKLAEAIPVTQTADRVPAIPRIAAAAQGRIPEQFLDPPAISGRYDSTIAATAVALFATDPRKYVLDPIDTRLSSGADAIAIGLEVHRILAGGAGSPEAADLAGRFLASELGRRAVRARRIEREFDFMIPIDDVLLRGQIDLWFEESGELILVDYKTDRDDAGQQTYALQLALYAIALERHTGRLPDRVVLYYLLSDRPVEVKIDTEAAYRAVRAFVAAHEAPEFPVSVRVKSAT